MAVKIATATCIEGQALPGASTPCNSAKPGKSELLAISGGIWVGQK